MTDFFSAAWAAAAAAAAVWCNEGLMHEAAMGVQET